MVLLRTWCGNVTVCWWPWTIAWAFLATWPCVNWLRLIHEEVAEIWASQISNWHCNGCSRISQPLVVTLSMSRCWGKAPVAPTSWPILPRSLVVACSIEQSPCRDRPISPWIARARRTWIVASFFQILPVLGCLETITGMLLYSWCTYIG